MSEIKTTKLDCGCVIKSKNPPIVETVELCSKHSIELINALIKRFAEKLVENVSIGKVSFRIESSDWIATAESKDGE